MSLLHLVNDGSFAVRGGPGWVNGSSAKGDKPAPTADDQLANVLRESLARQETRVMPTKHQIETAIAEARGHIETKLALAIAKRDEASEDIKRLRAELAAAPRLHVPRKYKKNEATEASPAPEVAVRIGATEPVEVGAFVFEFGQEKGL